jgi:1-deoxy-D-xylulose-5-phosphate reductoisomerase
MLTRRVILLGSTGSIGTQTVTVIEHLNALAARGQSPVQFEVVGLAAGRNADGLVEQAGRFPRAELALADGDAGADALAAARGVLGDRARRARRGPAAALELVQSVECDLVLGAMVGSSGLPATLEALRRGTDVALANKETLVAAGGLVVPVALKSGARLLPVDSEHSALWQCLVGRGPEASGVAGVPVPPLASAPAGVARVILTASGGPFRAWTKDRIENATVREALNHPTWSMGPKVTIDSASLTNKALEVIEAHWLYALGPREIGVLVHPQSIVHSFVEFDDGSVLAQLGSPDMRCPIQYALTFPLRLPASCRRMDWSTARGGEGAGPAGKMARLDFEEPDHERFPALRLAYEVIERGGVAGAVFNAANEAAVEAFLAERIPFGEIPRLSGRALREVGGAGSGRGASGAPPASLDDVLLADAEARAFVRGAIERRGALSGL